MHADSFFAARVRDTVGSIPAPAAPIQTILARAAQPEAVPRRGLPALAKLAIGAAAAIALLAVTLPVAAPSLAQTIESRIARLLGWTPPPPAPRAVTDAMKVRAVTLDEARSLVRFTLVPPSGLPSDAVAEKIYAAPQGVYDEQTHAWHVGDVSLAFAYRRNGNRFFTIDVSKFDSREGPPSKYVYNTDEIGANGLPARHEKFTWRNGDQVTQIVAGELDAAEILAIRAAMGGTLLRPEASRSSLFYHKVTKMRVIPAP